MNNKQLKDIALIRNKEQKIKAIKAWIEEDGLEDEFADMLHNQHEKCGEYCIDAGGAVINDIWNNVEDKDYIMFLSDRLGE